MWPPPVGLHSIKTHVRRAVCFVIKHKHSFYTNGCDLIHCINVTLSYLLNQMLQNTEPFSTNCFLFSDSQSFRVFTSTPLTHKRHLSAEPDPPAHPQSGSQSTLMVFLLCWWLLRRFGAFWRWTLRRKSNLTACWDILSWNWSKSWQRLDRLRLFWFSCSTHRKQHLDRAQKHTNRRQTSSSSEPKPCLLPLSAQRGLDTSICQQAKRSAVGPDSPCETEGDNNHTGSAEPTCNSCEKMEESQTRTRNAALCVFVTVRTNLLHE